MNKQDQIRQLLAALPAATLAYREAQDEMLAAKGNLVAAENDYREAHAIALGFAEGKNAEQRAAAATLNNTVRDAAAVLRAAQQDFNRAYRRYKLAEADLNGLRDVASLIHELEEQEEQ